MKKSKLLWIGVYIVIVAVILIGYQIYQYKVSNDLYTKLRTEVTIIEDADLKIDWSKLEKDVIGWIYFPKNNINYPIMQGETNKTYLNISYDKSNNVCGSIFLNSGNDAALTDVNSIIYGHNMADGSMFNDLKYYAEKEYWYNNPYFYVYLPDGTRHRYDIFVVQDVKDGTRTYTYSFATQQDYDEYLKTVKGQSLYDTGVKVDATDRIITLSTCQPFNSGNGYRRVIQAVETEIKKK